MRRLSIRSLAPLALLLAPLAACAQAAGTQGAGTQGTRTPPTDTVAARERARACPSCAEWNVPQPAARIHGNTWYVGTRGLSAVLVTSPQGHVLIDGALPESAPHILASIAALGFRIEDVRLILNSHAHFDHAGGLAALQRASGATVAVSAASARVLERGASEPDDPQYGELLAFPAVRGIRVIADGDTVRVGPLALVAHSTPGHTPGGTSWSWQSCDGARCHEVVYADSQSPISADGFLFTRNTTYPTALADFERGFTTLARMRCEVLITPHPGGSRLFERMAASATDATSAAPAGGGPAADAALVDPEACRRYAANARAQLARRVAAEKARPAGPR